MARRKTRRNSGQVHIAKNGTPYVILPNGKARFIKKSQARANGIVSLRNAIANPKRRKPARRNGLLPLHGANPNPKRRKARKNSTASQAQAKQAMRLFHSGQYPTLKQAWAAVKGGTSRANGRYKGTARAKWNTSYDAERDVYWAGQRASGTTLPETFQWGDYPHGKNVWNERFGQFSTDMTGGFQPVNRRNPKKRKVSKRKSRR